MGRTAATTDNTITRKPQSLGKKTFSLNMQEFLDLMLNRIVKINIVDDNWITQLTLTRKDVLDRCIIRPHTKFLTNRPYAIYVVDYAELS